MSPYGFFYMYFVNFLSRSYMAIFPLALIFLAIYCFTLPTKKSQLFHGLDRNHWPTNKKSEILRPSCQKFENLICKQTQENEISRLIQNASEISRSEHKSENFFRVPFTTPTNGITWCYRTDQRKIKIYFSTGFDPLINVRL